jgi:phosphate transport system permease protein
MNFRGVKLDREIFMKYVFGVAAFTAVGAVLLICVFLFSQGLPAMAEVGVFRVLTGDRWFPTHTPPEFGLLPMIFGSIYVTTGAILIGVPIGILTAVFMAKICPKPLYRVLKPLINVLAGIPSVVYGFFGIVVIVPQIQRIFGLSGGTSMLAAAILLGTMILPTIITITESSIRAVPREYYEGAVALGASHERAVFRVVLPAAKSGVMAAIALGIGRAIGETMAVVMVAGNQTLIRLPYEITSGVRTLTANVVMEMSYAEEGLHRSMLIATGVVLFMFILLINTVFNSVIRKGDSPKAANKAKKGPPAGVVVGAIVGAIIGVIVVPNIGIVPSTTKTHITIDFITNRDGVVFEGSLIDAEIKDGVIRGANVNGESIGRIETVSINGELFGRTEISDALENFPDVRENATVTGGEVTSIEFNGQHADALIGLIFGAILAAFIGKNVPDKALKYATWAAGAITLVALSFIIGYILLKGIPNLTPELFRLKWSPDNQSMLPALINTAAMVIATLMIAVPVGVFSAIFLVEYAKRGNKFVKIIRTMTETLAGIPSIVYGLFGLIFFVQVLGWGFSLLAGAFTLSIMVLPIIMRTTEEALKSVSDTYREGSFGLGAGRLRTVFRIVLPAAAPGILSGIILSVGRIVGETAALMFTAGMFAQVLETPMSSTRTLAGHMFVLSSEGQFREQAHATAVVLLLLVIVINTISTAIAKKVGKA